MSRNRELQFISGEHDHQRCISSAMTNAEHLCLQRGQRFTALRKRVFELVWQQHKPIGAYEILEKLQPDGRSAPPTVYRALDFLLDLGLIHRINSLNAYVGCIHPEYPHDGHFFICESCKAFAELDSPLITAAIEQSAADVDFEVHRHTVEIMGLCPRCRIKICREDKNE
ncbi:Fur family transcriptional regulator [uncultured Desulfuromusa sp.]|uniref:Fur family transcriptional regulator n=1 Tax=uncultured Desulfuromusa sp. TaxID=219183 RepID=UPI002AA6DDEF|nr:Fur family transcriptional regulator [uncultured Desulfuromusa sp.]